MVAVFDGSVYLPASAYFCVLRSVSCQAPMMCMCVHTAMNVCIGACLGAHVCVCAGVLR